MKAMKKLCSAFLVLAMALGMLPGIAAAAEIPVFSVASLAKGDKVLYAKYFDGVTEDGALTESAWQTNITLADGVKFGATWDTETLYLGFTGTAAPTDITLNGVSVTRAGTAGAATREIRIPLSEAGLSVTDYDPMTKLSVTLGSSKWEGTLVFDSVEGTAIDKFPASKSETNAQAAYNSGTKTLRFTGSAPSGTVLARYHGFGDDKSASNNPALAEPFKIIDPAKPAVAFEFDCRIDKLPVFKQEYTTLWQKETCPGLYFIVGGKSANTDGALANTNSAGMTFGLTHTEDGVVLTVRATDFKDGDPYANTAKPPKSFVLDKTLGQQFHLRMNYDASTDTIDIFVDDVYVGRIENAEFDNPFQMTTTTPSHIQVGAYSTDAYIATGANAFDITVSNMTLGAQKKRDPAILLDNLNFNTIRGNNEAPSAIYSSLTLPNSVPGPLFVPLTWTSDRPEVISNDGKVGVVTRDETVILTAALTDAPSQTKSFTVTVKGPETAQASPAKAEAAFANPTVTVDGVLNEDGWRMGGRILDQKSLIAAEYGFQWNQTHLFAAIDFAHDVGALTLSFNGHTFTVENGKLLENGGEVAGAKLAVGDGIVELSLPLSAIGMGSKISQYDKSMPISVKADGITGPATTLTLTDVDWFAADGRNYKSPGSSFGSQIKVTGHAPVEGYQGATRLENSWHLYDLYNPNGTNPAGVRTYVMYSNPGFDDRTAGTRLEFDFYAKSMPLGLWDDPHVGTGSHANYGFAFVFGTKADANKESWAVPCGIVNTEDGLVFVMRNEVAHKINLDKQVGDTFTVAAEWHRDDTLDVFVDGQLKGTFTAASMWKLGAANQSVVFNLHRNPQLPGATGPEDSYDFTISNISFGHSYDEGGALGALSFADIAGSNTSPNQITGNLIMTGTITDGLLDNTYPVTWTSSDESVVTRTGVVTRPETGASFATVTATADGQSKSFDVVVLGKTMDNSKVLHKLNDLNPATGAGGGSDELLFTFDTTNNSIIAVKEQVETINLVTLTDGDDKARLNAESLTLWVSNDNKTYTQVEDFKLVHIDRNWYLYDFEAQGKYIKVHYTQYRGGAADFVGAYGQMITAGYDASLAKGSSAKEYTVTNDTTVQYDPALPITGLTGDLSRIRVFDKSGDLLYHYVDGNTVMVRVPELALGADAKVYVQRASSGAIELASKENVYEVTYGKREIYVNATSNRYHRWVLSLPAGTKFANGSILKQDTLYSMGGELYVSTDGGRTLTLHSKVINTAPSLKDPVERMGGSGGWIFDSRTGRMFFHFYYIYNRFNSIDSTQSHCEMMVAASDNGGKSWYLVDTLPRDVVNDPQSTYLITYSDGTELSWNDGKGPNVDFVFPVGAQLNNMGGFCARVVYSKDGGESWHLSESLLTYKDIADHKEGGCSEAYIQEREDGVLVLYTRCQGDEIDNFGVSYSLDQGVTWMEEVSLSKMYTTNTQPMIRDMEVNGKTADLSIWGGNNINGGLSYTRNPLNVAVSTNDSETYRNIQNLFFETEMETYDYFDHLVTNHSLAKVNGDDLYLTVYNQPQTQYLNMFVQDFDKWLTRTRGGYDNFEHGTVRFEGWITVAGGTELSTTNARDKYSMQILKDSVITRSVPYLQNGTVSMELYAPANASFTLELQSAFSKEYGDVAMPIGLRAENGKLYMNNSGKAIGTLKAGWNTLTFDLELTEDAATLSVNGGEPVALDVLTRAGDYVCYITFGTKSDIWVDEVLVTSELEPVMESTAADKAAADKVIDQIKALENLPADQREEKAAEVLAAYDALTQTQQDLIDRNVLADPKAPVEQAMVNYYQVLMSYATPMTFKDVKVGDWYYDAVAYATANGIMAGYNAEQFGPNDPLTRAMVVQVLYNKEGKPALNGLKHSFSDVPADQWFNNAVTWGSNRGVVRGFGGGVFKPNADITIEEVAVILRNYSGSPNGNGDLSKVGNHSAWAADALKWAVEQGILDNVPFTNATEQATRAQTAQMLTNYLSK